MPVNNDNEQDSIVCLILGLHKHKIKTGLHWDPYVAYLLVMDAGGQTLNSEQPLALGFHQQAGIMPAMAQLCIAAIVSADTDCRATSSGVGHQHL